MMEKQDYEYINFEDVRDHMENFINQRSEYIYSPNIQQPRGEPEKYTHRFGHTSLQKQDSLPRSLNTWFQNEQRNMS